MRYALAALALMAAVGPTAAQLVPPTVPKLLAAEAKAHQACEGRGDLGIVREQCRLRDRLSGRLAKAGYCWGSKGQTDQKKEWHACQPASIYEDDVAGLSADWPDHLVSGQTLQTISKAAAFVTLQERGFYLREDASQPRYPLDDAADFRRSAQ